MFHDFRLRFKTIKRRYMPQILNDCNVNDLFNINKRRELITRCETLILVTGLAAKHCNHPNQMESYRSLHRSLREKNELLFKLIDEMSASNFFVDQSTVKQTLFKNQ